MSTKDLIARRHPEWVRNHVRWRWLLDSLEGGDTYRYASYGSKVIGGQSFAERNLVRHKHEVPEAGKSEHPDYALRLERTPVPTLMEESIGAHLSEVFSREITREHPDQRLMDWWNDVDGAGTSADEWWGDTIAPMLLALGQIDLIFDRPRVPEGVVIETQAQRERYGTDRCVASFILPENMLWWRRDPVTKRYMECLVRECSYDDDGSEIVRYRHWTVQESVLYEEESTTDDQGVEMTRVKVVERIRHGYGRVPIARVFDRENPRKDNIGLSRYEVVAELQREAYNKESELILSNAQHSHPTVQAPEDFCQQDAIVPVGPGVILPKKKVQQSGGGYTYEGWDYVEPPQGPSDSLRRDQERVRDAVDRSARLTKPAGARGTDGSTVSQSGISKALDQRSGNALLGKIAQGVLQKGEWEAAEFALCVLKGGPTEPAERDAIRVVYPASFNLLTAEELATGITEFQGIATAIPGMPLTSTLLLQRYAHELLVGADDQTLAAVDDEIEAYVETEARRRDEEAEGPAAIEVAGMVSTAPPETGAEETEDEGIE